jgi:hypothetical protein
MNLFNTKTLRCMSYNFCFEMKWLCKILSIRGEDHISQGPAPYCDSTFLGKKKMQGFVFVYYFFFVCFVGSGANKLNKIEFNARPNEESEIKKDPPMTQLHNTKHCIKEVFLFEVKSEMAGRVKECAMNDLKRPVLTEYDFRRDDKNPSFQATLRTTTKIRYYQVSTLIKRSY